MLAGGRVSRRIAKGFALSSNLILDFGKTIQMVPAKAKREYLFFPGGKGISSEVARELIWQGKMKEKIQK